MFTNKTYIFVEHFIEPTNDNGSLFIGGKQLLRALEVGEEPVHDDLRP